MYLFKACVGAFLGLAVAAASAEPCDEGALRQARSAFNAAIRDDDIAALRALFAEDIVLVTGTDSDVIMGRESQLQLWRAEVGDPNSLSYLRETADVQISSRYGLGIESGAWTGSAPAGDEVGGEYSAKWRCDNAQWILEAEIFTTMRCTGALCDR